MSKDNHKPGPVVEDQLSLDEKYHIVRERVDELAQYANGLDNPKDLHEMLVWLRDEHKALVEEAFVNYSRYQEARRLYTELARKYADLNAAVEIADRDHPAIEQLWQEIEKVADEEHLLSVIVNIAGGCDLNPTDASTLLACLTRPDQVSAFGKEKIARHLQRIAGQLLADVEAEPKAS